MSSPAVTARAGVTAGEAARLMCRHRVEALPVVDGRGRLAGIVGRGEVLGGLCRADGEIGRAVLGEVIAGEFLLDPQAFRVTVRDGVVTLSGRPESAQVGRLLAAAVRRVEGVVSLRDQLRPAGQDPAPSPRLPGLYRAAAALALALR